MRLLALGLVLLAALPAAADDRPRRRPDIDVVVPVPPVEHERLHFFGKRDRHLVPGTVTINQSPYACDTHQLPFTDRDRFVAHLRQVHRLPADRIPHELVVIDGRVHFVGD